MKIYFINLNYIEKLFFEGEMRKKRKKRGNDCETKLEKKKLKKKRT